MLQPFDLWLGKRVTCIISAGLVGITFLCFSSYENIMAENKTHTYTVNQLISSSSEYFRISRAAEELGCSTDDLLHLGATGNAEIMAPVLVEGMYEWQIPLGGREYSELIDSAKYHFSAFDRVILSWKDLAKIEAKGWTVPEFFYSPLRAKEFDELLELSRLEPSVGSDPDLTMTVQKKENNKLISAVTYSLLKLTEFDSNSTELRKAMYNSAWFSESPPLENAERTTLQNLFISKVELIRLKQGLPQDGVAIERKEQADRITHGNVERFAEPRVAILKAAIFCKASFPDLCNNNRAWAKLIDEKSPLFWPETCKPPLELNTIERLLGEALDDAKQREKNSQR